jgi:hypothetical protein
MRNKIIVLLILGVTITAGISSYIGRGWAVGTIKNGPFITEITAEALPLNRDQPGVNTVGSLHYVAGWSLTAESDFFGGFSGLLVGADGKSIIALSDRGDWLSATLDITSKTPLTNGLLYPFEKDAHSKTKSAYDAESLVRTEDGFLVGLEQWHRIVAFDSIGGTNRMAPYNDLIDLSVMSSNGGLEAMTTLADGRLFMMAERGLDLKGTLPVWIADKKQAETRRFSPPKNYSPTDAVSLPNGDVMLLMRHFSTLDGVSAKLMLIPSAEINGDGVIKGRELAHLAPSFSVDNMEALDARLLPNGKIRLYMMSDDNFSMRQRTLLMIFDWQP